MKTQLLTISAISLLLLGQSAMAFEQINSENGYDAAFQNGWVSPETVAADAMDLVKTSFRSNPEMMDNSRFEDATSIDYLSTN